MKNIFNTFRKNKENPLITCIDIGSSKVACLICSKSNEHNKIKVIGFGQHASIGFDSGTVTDAEKLSLCIGNAISTAEKMAGISINDAIIVLNGGEQYSEIFSSEISVAGNDINEWDIQRLLNNTIKNASLDNRSILHAIPIRYKIDGSSPIRNPIGMIADKLYAEINICSIRESALSNVARVIEKNHIKVKKFISSSLANGIGCLLSEEKNLGAVVIDLGASTSSVGIFIDKCLNYSFEIPIGGNHISKDIASGLASPLIDAERVKVLNGNLLSSFNSFETINIPTLGDDPSNLVQSVSSGLLNEIIKSRVLEILELISLKLNSYKLNNIPLTKVVFTGGGSLITGLPEIASDKIARHIRIGKPIRIEGMPDAAFNPFFTSIVGSIYSELYFKKSYTENLKFIKTQKNMGGLYKIYQWLETYV